LLTNPQYLDVLEIITRVNKEFPAVKFYPEEGGGKKHVAAVVQQYFARLEDVTPIFNMLLDQILAAKEKFLDTIADGGTTTLSAKEQDSMFCVKCGQQLPDDANFCLKCGRPQRSGIVIPSEGTGGEHELARLPGGGGVIVVITSRRVKYLRSDGRPVPVGPGEAILSQVAKVEEVKTFLGPRQVVLRSAGGQSLLQIFPDSKEESATLAQAIRDAIANS
jgi:ribosomal protein L40E